MYGVRRCELQNKSSSSSRYESARSAEPMLNTSFSCGPRRSPINNCGAKLSTFLDRTGRSAGYHTKRGLKAPILYFPMRDETWGRRSIQHSVRLNHFCFPADSLGGNPRAEGCTLRTPEWKSREVGPQGHAPQQVGASIFNGLHSPQRSARQL